MTDSFTIAPQQPIETDLSITDSLFVKSFLIPKAGTFLPQHVHNYDHVSVVAAGGVGVWEEDEFRANYRAPASLVIPAGKRHTFRTLANNTVILCVHRADFEVTEEHQIVAPPGQE